MYIKEYASMILYADMPRQRSNSYILKQSDKVGIISDMKHSWHIDNFTSHQNID